MLGPSTGDGEADAPLVVLSNRLPFALDEGGGALQPVTGGVAGSIDGILRRRGGTWIGWPGVVAAEGQSTVVPGDTAAYRIVPLSLSESEIEHYYNGFANCALWPLLHSMPEAARFAEIDWRTYVRVNRRFADSALAATTRETPVWVNDYHLLCVPGAMRESAPGQRIVFFLHIPFPPVAVFEQCPWHQELMRGLLGSDVVGLQTRLHVDHFLRAAERLPGAVVDRGAQTVRHAQGCTRVDAFPIGADFDTFDRWAREHPPTAVAGPPVLLGVDRLDYTKGIPQRIRAFARLLETRPQLRERVTLTQIAVPSRPHLPQYQRLRTEVETLVDDCNRQFGTPGWRPIDYRYELLRPETLAALYRNAAVALVTPLSDGMNLVAKEYVASQVDCRGVLVLSRSAGASEAMLEALIVEPDDTARLADAIEQALAMSEPERHRRMQALRDREQTNTLHAWASRLLASLPAPREESTASGDSHR